MLRDLTLDSNKASFPLEITSTLVVVEYPIPGFTTTTLLTLPSEIVALISAPDPDPEGSTTFSSGIEK